MEIQVKMLTVLDVMILMEASPKVLKSEAEIGAKHALAQMNASQWTDRFCFSLNDEFVFLPYRLNFSSEGDRFSPATNASLMMRALRSRSNDGFQRQKAVRGLLQMCAFGQPHL
jgi:hypothetical protein